MTDDNERAPLFDRDYSDEFSITLEWGEWNKLFSLMARGLREKHGEDWPEEEYDRDRKLRKKVVARIGGNKPGNGADDWPDDMKRAYSKAVRDMFDEIREE